MNDYICVSCNEYGKGNLKRGFWTDGGVGPFCAPCWEALRDPDQALLTEKRLAQAESEIERQAAIIEELKACVFPNLVEKMVKSFAEELMNDESGMAKLLREKFDEMVEEMMEEQEKEGEEWKNADD